MCTDITMYHVYRAKIRTSSIRNDPRIVTILRKTEDLIRLLKLLQVSTRRMCMSQSCVCLC